MNTRISVIIPALNEAGVIAGALASAAAEPDAELIVVDGGSRDATAEIARSHGATVVTAPLGRACQMNAGAHIATGEYLLFLHADTRLAPRYADEVRRILGLPGVAAGAFELKIDGTGWGLRLVERAANLRSRLLELPLGDQAFFLKAALFRSLGGYSEIPLLEDLELARRLRRRGRIVTASIPALTSARRWESVGPLRATLLNQFFLLAYLAGIPPRQIATWYYRRG
ncbi:MAG: glycosyltransferase [Acidobacteria bacterium RIFCSPLOWO2_02_FULL_61_28]|nr:MAG: glycosyltransferase [Acidobacteria bacterium RIFCSPLOWO2_02_FULL_61_28]